MIRRGLYRCLLTAALGAWMALSIAVQPATVARADIGVPGDPAAGVLVAVEQAMLDLTNADRVANGLDPLELDRETLGIARARAASQLGTPTLSHYDANGELAFVRLLASAQIDYLLAGENLARAGTEDATVSSRVEQALMKSATHRKNILEPTFTRVAIGSATNAQGQITIAEVYRN